MHVLIVDKGEAVNDNYQYDCEVQIGNETKTLVKFHSTMLFCPEAPNFGMNFNEMKDRMYYNFDKRLQLSSITYSIQNLDSKLYASYGSRRTSH